MKSKSGIVYRSVRRVILTLVTGTFLLVYGCGTQNQLKKAWMNQSEIKLQESFGAPTTIIERESDKIFVFEKQEELKSTEISQGKLALDPIMSPKVMKTERYIFTIREGIIIRTNFEEEYERY